MIAKEIGIAQMLKIVFTTHVNNEGPHQSAHPQSDQSLVSLFTESLDCLKCTSRHPWPWCNCMDMQAKFGLHCPHIMSCKAAQKYYPLINIVSLKKLKKQQH